MPHQDFSSQSTIPSQPQRTPSQPTVPAAAHPAQQRTSAQQQTPAKQRTVARGTPPGFAALTQRMRPVAQPPAAQQTVANRPVTPGAAPLPVYPNTMPHPASRALPIPAAPVHSRSSRTLILVLGLVLCSGILLMLGMLAVGALALYGSDSILPRVSALGVDLGGLSEAAAAAKLSASWSTLTLIDPATGAIWQAKPEQLGITLDAPATAARAHQQGRTRGSILSVIGGIRVDPVLQIKIDALTTGLQTLLPQIETPALNAGVRLVNGQVEASPACNGRRVDLTATLAPLQQNAALALADGRLELVMYDTAPAIADSTALVQAARNLLTQPLSIRAYDPVTGDIARWDAPPEQWAGWLTPDSSLNNPNGLAINVSADSVRAFLTDSANRYLDASRYLDLEKSVTAVQDAVQHNQTTATIRVYHHDTQHTVQSGETIISIAWDYGVPYLWIQQANNGISSVTVGQTITIPSADNFLQYEPIPDKRIEVSISQQRVRVYENGGLKWDWVASTGIPDSPTWPGIYQIISHVSNAYAANWNLWMPNFMGVYQPIPGADFTNGFHGFPTRGGGQLLWENNLGTKVTYGCILLSNENAATLYNWAQEGVVVEIQP